MIVQDDCSIVFYTILKSQSDLAKLEANDMQGQATLMFQQPNRLCLLGLGSVSFQILLRKNRIYV